MLDALGMLDGDRIEPGASLYAQEVLKRLLTRGTVRCSTAANCWWAVAQADDFHPILLVLSLSCWLLRYRAGIPATLSWFITGDKIDSSNQPAGRVRLRTSSSSSST